MQLLRSRFLNASRCRGPLLIFVVGCVVVGCGHGSDRPSFNDRRFSANGACDFGSKPQDDVQVLHNVHGDRVVSAGNHNVIVAGANGMLSLITTSGNITVSGMTGAIHAQTSNGNACIEGTIHGNSSIQTENGNLTLIIPSDNHVTWQLETISGRIQNDFDPAGNPSGRIGSGADGVVTMRSENGNLAIRRR